MQPEAGPAAAPHSEPAALLGPGARLALPAAPGPARRPVSCPLQPGLGARWSSHLVSEPGDFPPLF